MKKSSRPIMDIIIFLLSIVVMAIIIIVCSYFGNKFKILGFMSPAVTPYPSIGALSIVYVVPCLFSLVIVILKNIVIPRKIRYAFAIVSGLALFLVGMFCIACIFTPQTSELHRSLIKDLTIFVEGPLLFPFGIAGLLMGLALPVIPKTKAQAKIAKEQKEERKNDR